MNIFASLANRGMRDGTVDKTWAVQRGWELHIDRGELRPITTPVVIPKRIGKRGSAAKTKPNYMYDTGRHALSDGLFLDHCIQCAIAAEDRELLAALQHYKENPVCSRKGLHKLKKGAEPSEPILVDGKAVKLEDWVVLMYKGNPIGTRPKMFAEFERRSLVALEDGVVGCCLITGEKETPLANCHPEITFGPKGGSTTNLFSANEGGNHFQGAKQGDNFTASIVAAQVYTSTLNRQFEHAAFLTDNTVIVSWPEQAVDHPIINLIKALAYKWYKSDQAEEVEAYWRQLETLPRLETPITIAAMQNKTARLCLRHYRTLRVGVVRSNMLAIRERFRDRVPILTFSRVIPYGDSLQDGKTYSVSDTCYLDTVWSLLTGEPWPAPLHHIVRQNLRHGQRTQLMIAWLEMLSGLPPAKENEMTTKDLDHYHKVVDRDIDTRLEALLRICDSHLISTLNDKPAYRWGRYVAASCLCKIYYHSLRGKRDLPNPKRDALQRGARNPVKFRGSYKPDFYAEQMLRRTKGLKVRAFELLYNLLTLEPEPPRKFTIADDNLVRMGFEHQMLGLTNLLYKSRDDLLEIYRDAMGVDPTAAVDIEDDDEENDEAA